MPPRASCSPETVGQRVAGHHWLLSPCTQGVCRHLGALQSGRWGGCTGDASCGANRGWERSYGTKPISYSWQSPRGLGSCGADRCPGCISHFCPCTVVTSLSMPSAGSLAIIHTLTRLQEMSQFAVCFASEPARLLACVWKAIHAMSHRHPLQRGHSSGIPSSSRTRAGRGFVVLRYSPSPLQGPADRKAPPTSS